MKNFLIMLLFLILLTGFVGCGSGGSKNETTPSPSTNLIGPGYTIKYEITGTATNVDITYENEDGGTSQESEVSLPWSYAFKASKGTFVYVSAQNHGQSGNITVTIYQDNEKFKTSTSNGTYVIATASGSVGEE